MRFLRDEGVAVDGDAEPSTASGGCSEAEHPQRSKKSSKRAARRYFRAPQGGGGRCACGYLGSVSVRSTDDALASFVSSTASDRKGFVKGESVPLDRILVPFVRTKGTPRRRAVQIMPLQKAPRRRRQDEIWYKGGRGARVRDYIFPRGNPAGRRKKLAPQGFDNLRNVH